MNNQKHIIRVKTESYCDSKNQLIIKKTIRQMRSLTENDGNGYFVFEEEIENIGTDILSDEMWCEISHLADGLYEVKPDWSAPDYEYSNMELLYVEFIKIDEDSDKLSGVVG